MWAAYGQLLSSVVWVCSSAVSTCILQDYHRFHLPVSGTIRCIRHVRGKLYTVNPIAVASTYANVFTQVLTTSTAPFRGILGRVYTQPLKPLCLVFDAATEASVCCNTACRTSERW